MKPEKDSTIYLGIGRNGIWPTHKDKDPVSTGTAKTIATSLKFKTVLEMKEYIDEYL